MCIFKYNFLYFSILFSNIVKHLTSILLIFFRTFPFFQEKTELFRVHSKKLRYTSSFFCQYISDMEKRSYDPEIYQNRTGIQNCSDQRCRHDRRIQTDLLCSQRQNATDRLCHNNNSNHRNSDRHCQHHILIVHNIDAKPINHRQTTSAIRTSLKITRKMSLNSISPTAIPRITSVELWDPQFPPVPISIGINVIRTGITAIALSYRPNISPVTVADNIRSINQRLLFLACRNTEVPK